MMIGIRTRTDRFVVIDSPGRVEIANLADLLNALYQRIQRIQEMDGTAISLSTWEELAQEAIDGLEKQLVILSRPKRIRVPAYTHAISIDCLGLSRRVRNRLNLQPWYFRPDDWEIFREATVGSILDMLLNEPVRLLALPNFGPKSLEELKAELVEHGFLTTEGKLAEASVRS